MSRAGDERSTATPGRSAGGAPLRPGARAADVTVRQATLSDLDTVVELRIALLRGAPEHPIYGRLRADAEQRAHELFATQLTSSAESTFLAERGGRVIGILRCVETRSSPLLDPSRYCYVSSVYVRPDERRRGVLRALFARARRWCDERGLREMRLHNVPDHDDASAAWDALGFEVVEHVRLLRFGRR